MMSAADKDDISEVIMTDSEHYKDSITEIQTRLRELHYAGYPIDLIIPDGIYDSATRTAVMQFQRFFNLPVTGTVDRATWDELYGAYRASVFARSRANPLYPFPEQVGYVLTPGEVSDIVMIIQIMLGSLSAHYDDIKVAPTGEYDEQTRRAVESFQRHSGLPVTGHIDKATWNRLADMYNKYNNIDT